MSAYGKIETPSGSKEFLKPRTFKLPSGKLMTVVHVRKDIIPTELETLMRDVFNGILEEGRTYPMEGQMDQEAFAGYYLAADLFVGILENDDSVISQIESTASQQDLADNGVVRESAVTIETVRNGRTWQDCVLGMYYVKPNYPGRSSHNCNGGFIVLPKSRGLKVGIALGKSYLKFAPQLGYKSSVFNLVYANNLASIAIWDRLGFTRAGLIPKAGRLKKADGSNEEEYVDAHVYYKEFE